MGRGGTSVTPGNEEERLFVRRLLAAGFTSKDGRSSLLVRDGVSVLVVSTRARIGGHEHWMPFNDVLAELGIANDHEWEEFRDEERIGTGVRWCKRCGAISRSDVIAAIRNWPEPGGWKDPEYPTHTASTDPNDHHCPAAK